MGDDKIENSNDLSVTHDTEKVVSETGLNKPAKRLSPYEYFQTDKGRRDGWYIGIMVGTVAFLSAAYTFWPKANTPTLVCSSYETQNQRYDCMLEQGTITSAEYIQMAEAMRVEIAPATKGIPLAQLDPNSSESRFENAVRNIAAGKDQARREALVLARHPDTRASGLDKLAALAKTPADWRQVGELAYPWDTARATKAYDGALTAGSKNVWDYVYLSRLHERGGNLNAAKDILKKTSLLEISDRDKSAIYDETGNVVRAQGDLAAARKAYEDGLEIRERLAKADGSNTGFQRDLAVSYERLAVTAIKSEDFESAQSWLEKELIISLKLERNDPSNAGMIRFNAVVRDMLGGVHSQLNKKHLAAEQWAKAYAAMKALDDAGKMQPVDQEWFEALAQKVAALDRE